MRGHVVGAFVVMFVTRAFGRDPLEIALEIALCRGSGIFLDHKRGRRVAAKNRQQTLGNACSRSPADDFR